MRVRSLVVGAIAIVAVAHPRAQGTYVQVADIKIGGPLPAQWDYHVVDGDTRVRAVWPRFSGW